MSEWYWFGDQESAQARFLTFPMTKQTWNKPRNPDPWHQLHHADPWHQRHNPDPWRKQHNPHQWHQLHNPHLRWSRWHSKVRAWGWIKRISWLTVSWMWDGFWNSMKIYCTDSLEVTADRLPRDSWPDHEVRVSNSSSRWSRWSSCGSCSSCSRCSRCSRPQIIYFHLQWARPLCTVAWST